MRPLLLLLVFLAVAACDNEPAEASVSNEIPDATIEKVWFRTTLFTTPLQTGQSSESLRVGTGVEHAFAVVRINGRAFVARTSDPIHAEPASLTRIVFSPTTSRSLCFGEPAITELDHAFITSRIFPGDEIEADPATCTAPPSPSPADAGSD